MVQGKAGGNEVYVPLLLLACILAFTYLNGQLIAFLNLKTELRLAGTYETALLDKRGKLEYWHIENDDSWNVVDRTCKEATEKLLRGFDSCWIWENCSSGFYLCLLSLHCRYGG